MNKKFHISEQSQESFNFSKIGWLLFVLFSNLGSNLNGDKPSDDLYGDGVFREKIQRKNPNF